MYVFRTSILVSITLENCIAVLCNADFTPCHIYMMQVSLIIPSFPIFLGPYLKVAYRRGHIGTKYLT